jgi:hypothetical protein
LALDRARVFAPPWLGSLQHRLRQRSASHHVPDWPRRESLTGHSLNTAYFRSAIYDHALSPSIKIASFAIDTADDAGALNEACIVDNQLAGPDAIMETVRIDEAEEGR